MMMGWRRYFQSYQMILKKQKQNKDDNVDESMDNNGKEGILEEEEDEVDDNFLMMQEPIVEEPLQVYIEMLPEIDADDSILLLTIILDMKEFLIDIYIDIPLGRHQDNLHKFLQNEDVSHRHLLSVSPQNINRRILQVEFLLQKYSRTT